MGVDKALLSLRGQPVIQLLASRLRELTDQVLLSVSDRSAYAFLGLPAIIDLYAGCGPMAGLHAAMHHARRRLILVLACDLPGVTTALLRLLVDSSAGFDAVIPVTADGRMHPACAVYARSSRAAVDLRLRAGDNRMLSLLDDPNLRVRRLTSHEGVFSDAELCDMNSPGEYEQFRQLFG